MIPRTYRVQLPCPTFPPNKFVKVLLHLESFAPPCLLTFIMYQNQVKSTHHSFHLADPRTVTANRKVYLSDPNGLETTPTLELANNHQYPPDVLNLTELDHRVLTTQAMTEKQKIEEAAYIGFMRAHGINIKKHEESREASREVLRSLRKRKETIGAGIDRGGCTLVNEAMREGFVQNPGIWRVVGAGE